MIQAISADGTDEPFGGHLGKLDTTQPAPWTSGGIGASFFNAKCARTILLAHPDYQRAHLATDPWASAAPTAA
jgi:hypothetical protein